ncbi:iron-containing alcohol dehydrogenase [Halomonas sp. CUBES01]|uniref:iron-containing alcohol dehydrogenase n=1 Tax=Halomonas sp. CUBES01 TaxID=2897340 RepID=UPI001E5DE7F1|nr:iron-containing alcohol dehydrogenase [Halomonas sp. CUBES01]MEC4766746.1 iron-containing alcohol dehydrogenase [Halomonas sp. CUBES01]
MPLNHFHTGRQTPIIAGPGSLEQLPELRSRLGASRYMVISDQGLAATGLVDALVDDLTADAEVDTFLAPPGEPSVATADAAAAAVRALPGRPMVIGLGGGTALDIAKLVAALAESQGDMENYLLARTPWSGRVPAVMVPTTSGTGSEVTRTSILTDAEGRKLWAWGDELLPDAVLLDPALTRGLPAPLTATTGLDAFVHALEATTGQGRHTFIEAPALQAIRQVGEALPIAVATPHNLEARQRMQEAACLAGQAIDNGGTGIAHNIGHALGSCFHLPHGVAVTLALEASLAWSVADNEACFAPAAHALKTGCKAQDLPRLFRELADQTRFNQALAPFATLTLDAEALALTMQKDENSPMARNAARRPTGEDWQWLADATVSVFERRVAELATQNREISA